MNKLGPILLMLLVAVMLVATFVARAHGVEWG